MELRGHPEKAYLSEGASDQATAARLWRVSEELTDVRYPHAQALRTADG